MKDAAARKKASDDLADIEALKRFEPFNRLFVRRVQEELEKRREIVLHKRDLTPEALHNERLLYLAALDTSNLMKNDETACRNTLGPEKDQNSP